MSSLEAVHAEIRALRERCDRLEKRVDEHDGQLRMIGSVASDTRAEIRHVRDVVDKLAESQRTYILAAVGGSGGTTAALQLAMHFMG